MTVSGAAPVPPSTQVVDAPAGEYCAFSVHIVIVSAQKQHDTGTGDVLFTGPLRATITNAATGATREYNLPGLTFVDAQTGITTVTGPQLIGQPASRMVGPAFLIATPAGWCSRPTLRSARAPDTPRTSAPT